MSRILICLVLCQLLWMSSLIGKELEPRWSLEVPQDTTLSATIQTNQFKPGTDSTAFPARFVYLMLHKTWFDTTSAADVPQLSRMRTLYRTKWLEIDGAGNIASTVSGSPQIRTSTITWDRQRVMGINTGEHAQKVRMAAHAELLTVPLKNVVGPIGNYEAFSLTPSGLTGVFLAGMPALPGDTHEGTSAAYFVDLGSGRITARIPNFFDFSYSPSGCLAGVQAIGHQGRIVVCDDLGGIVRAGEPNGWHRVANIGMTSSGKSVFYSVGNYMYALDVDSGETQLLEEMTLGQPVEAFYSQDGTHVVVVVALETMSLYTLPDRLMGRWQPQLVWSRAQPEDKMVLEVVIASNASFVAYHQTHRTPPGLELLVVGRDGQELGTVLGGHRGMIQGLEVIGSNWLFEGMEYPDSNMQPRTDAITTKRINLFHIPASGANR